MADSLTKQERALRQRFVEEYLTDYDAYSAAIRLGYQEEYAQDYSRQFLSEPYTLRLIKDREAEFGSLTEEEQHRRKIVAGLYREAHSRQNSGSARVAALGQLAKIIGIEAPVKTQQVLPKIGMTDLSKLTDEDLAKLEDLMNRANADT